MRCVVRCVVRAGAKVCSCVQGIEAWARFIEKLLFNISLQLPLYLLTALNLVRHLILCTVISITQFALTLFMFFVIKDCRGMMMHLACS